MTKSRVSAPMASGWACVAFCGRSKRAPMSGRLSSYICWSVSTGVTSSSPFQVSKPSRWPSPSPGPWPSPSPTPANSVRVMPDRLDPLLRPRSVVVVGSSPNPSFVSSILKNLLRSGYSGQVAAVNPRYESVLEAPCYPSVLEVPWPVDLAVVGVAWRQFPTLLEQCEQKRVGALVVITSGFAESGGDGIARQAQLSEWAQRTGTPVCGPNCLGLL